MMNDPYYGNMMLPLVYISLACGGAFLIFLVFNSIKNAIEEEKRKNEGKQVDDKNKHTKIG